MSSTASPAMKPRSNRPKKPTRKETGPQKIKSEDPSLTDEGYHSGNPPPPTIVTTPDYSKSVPLGSSVKTLNSSNNVNVRDRLRPVQYGTNNNIKPTAATTNGATTAMTTDPTSDVVDLAQSGVVSRPRLVQRSESHTFVFVYDEDAKTSKPVTAPDHDHGVDVPVLLQYGLTDDAIEQCLERPFVGATPTGDVDDDESRKPRVVNGVANQSRPPKGTSSTKIGGKDNFCSPTERLLRSRERDELKNRGMHVVKWLVSMENKDDQENKEDDINGAKS